jgi:3D (Asp-Asp-Asp) domain-containing protein
MKEGKKRSLPVEVGRVLLAAGCLLFFAWGDMPAPDEPATPPSAACPDRPDVGDYQVSVKAVSLLPPLQVVVTGYSLGPGETDDSPYLTALSTPTRPGVIALSRDLIRAFNPTAPFRFGDRVHLEGVGEFIVEDTMAERWNLRADIWFPTPDEAMEWGKRKTSITLVEPESGPRGSVRREASAPSE